MKNALLPEKNLNNAVVPYNRQVASAKTKIPIKSKTYFLLLSNRKNTIGIERSYGDFVIHNDYVRRWMEGDPVIFFSGLQILNPKIFDNFESTKFSMNKIWDKLILEKKLKAKIMKSKLFHIGDIKTFNKIIP